MSYFETESPGVDDNSSQYKPQKLNYAKFTEAKKYVKKLKLKNEKEWKKYCKGELKKLEPKPYFIPSNPEFHYCFEGWVSWEQWLGIPKS